MVINTNVSAQKGVRYLGESSELLGRSLARLSSGSKIISPEDDAAGAAVSLRFRAQINRIGAVITSLNNAVSLNQTQDGFLKKVAKALDRMSELAIMAQDVTKTDTDRALYNGEFAALAKYITDMSNKTFNDVTLFDGTDFQVITDSEGNKYTTAGVDMGDTAYSDVVGNTIDTMAHATSALVDVKAAISQVAMDRAALGANISLLSSYIGQNTVLKESMTEANSRIEDVDVAQESAEYARFNILVQAGTAMLAQANTQPQMALRLLNQ